MTAKKLSPERLTEHLRTLRLAVHGNPFAAIAVIETAEHIEALETETTARGKVWAEQTVQRCDATAKIEALEAQLAESKTSLQIAHAFTDSVQQNWAVEQKRAEAAEARCRALEEERDTMANRPGER